MESKKKYTLNDDILKAPLVPDDNIHRVVKKIATMIRLGSIGASDFPLDNSVQPSGMGLTDCLAKWNVYLLDQKKKIHPASAITVLNVDNDVKIGKASFCVGKENFQVRQATPLVGDNAVFNAHCATVADILATSYRYHETDGFVNSIQKKEERELLGVPDMHSMQEVIKMGVKEKNAHQSSQIYYEMLIAKPVLAMKLVTKIIERAPAGHCIVSDNLTKLVYKDQSSVPKENKQTIKVPVSTVPVLRSYDNLDLCYQYLERSRAYRGEDAAGVGAVSIGYGTMKMPRNYAKAWSFVQDMGMLCTQYGFGNKRLTFMSSPGPFKLNALVASGFQVSVSQCQDKLKDPNSLVPGIYMTLPDSVIIRDYKSLPPTIRKTNVTHLTDERFGNLLESLKMGMVVALHLHPGMLEMPSEIKILPSSMPHNGIVYLGHFKRGVEFKDCVIRFSEANSHRNTFVYHRVPYCAFDKFDKFYDLEVIFPKTKMVKELRSLYKYEPLLREIEEVKLDPMDDVNYIPDEIPDIDINNVWRLIVNASANRLKGIVEEYYKNMELSYSTQIAWKEYLLLDLRTYYTDFSTCHNSFMNFDVLRLAYNNLAGIVEQERKEPESDGDEGDDIVLGQTKKEDDDEEEDDGTNELLAALQNDASVRVTGVTVSKVTDKKT